MALAQVAAEGKHAEKSVNKGSSAEEKQNSVRHLLGAVVRRWW